MATDPSDRVMTSMRLPRSDRETVREIAAEHGQSLTEATIEAWQMYIAHHEKLRRASRR